MKTKTKRVSDTAVLDSKKLKRLPRGSFLAKTGDRTAKHSILIDLDVLNFFKERASKTGALAYQTQINQILRAHVEGKEQVDATSLAHDDRFIRAVAKRVKQLSSRQKQSA